MKTRLLLTLLLISSISFAQNWTQVGSTQFSTNFAKNGEIAFNNSGTPFVLYEDPTVNKVFVMTFNGTNWVDVGSGAISNENYNNLAIKINPTTNQPWVALKAEASGSASNIDVFSFNGTSWVSEGSNVGGGFYTYGIQLQFSTTGTPRIAGVIGAGGSDRRPQFYTKSGSGWVYINGEVGLNARVDFNDFESYTLADSNGRIRRNNIGSAANASHTNSVAYREISSAFGTDYYASNDVTNNTIVVGKYGETITQPTGVANNTHSILKFGESITDNQFYLMFSDNTENLVFQKYRNTDVWSVLPSIGIATNTTDFFVKMEMNPTDGNMYVLYKDGGRMSVKKYTVEQPLNLPRIYVKDSKGNPNAGLTKDGSSWSRAYSNLNDALENIYANTTEIWVASGTYNPGDSREDSFDFKFDGLSFYGGFTGTETTISERDIRANPTILSGDLDGDDAGVDFATVSRSDNSYHIVKITANNILLDGFTIQDGHANGGTGNNDASAIYKSETVNALHLKNCTIKNNVSLVAGSISAWFDINGTVNIENCTFDGNVSTYSSGLYLGTRNNRTLNVTIVNSLFSNNVSKDNGATLGFTGSSAWIRANGSGSTITTNIVNSTFANNADTGTQAALVNKGTLSLARTSGTHNATISNSIFFNNTEISGATSLAVSQGHASAANVVNVTNSIDEDNFSNLTYLTNTSSADPMFIDASNNDFKLQAGSPAIDSGDNTKIPAGVLTDLLGNSRIFNTNVDMGVYEYGSALPVNYTLTLNNTNGSVTTNPNGNSFSSNTNVELTAVADAGYKFDNWSGDATGTTNPLSITMDADKTVTANFSLICTVAFTDVNFKNLLLANVAINTNNDSEIQCSEATAFTGRIYVVNNNIASLDGIAYFTNITELFARGNQLTSLDLSSNTSLVRIEVSNNMLTSIVLSPLMVSLERFSVSNNPLTTLDVTNYVDLIELGITSTNITTIDLSNNPDLNFIEALSSQLTGLDLSSNTSISSVYVGGQNLTSLDLRNGNLSNIGYVETHAAPNLTCIFVDDKTDVIINNWLLNANNNIVETAAECSTLSTDNFENISSFTLYPNPVKNNVYVESKEEILKIEVYNLLGKKILQKENSSFIDLSGLKPSMYLVRIYSAKNSISKRIIKN